MENYKYNMAECTHSGVWQEDMLGRKCLDCGFSTLTNDYGMYEEFGQPKVLRHDETKHGTKQKKFRKGNNKKYFKRRK